MSYRNDRDADEARIASLEGELAETKRRLAEVEGRHDQALVLASKTALERSGSGRSASQRWFGAPLELALAKELAGVFPTDKFEDVIERIRMVTGDHGRSEILKSSLTWSATAMEKGIGPFTTITISTRGGVTKVLATDRLSQLAGALYGGLGGGVGGGGAAAPIFATMAVPVLAPVFFLAWFGGIYWGTRAIFKRAARGRARRLQRLFDAVCEEVARGIP